MNIVYLKDSFDPSYTNRDEIQIALQAAAHGHKVSIITTDYDLNFKKDLQNLLEKDKKLLPNIKVYRRKGSRLPKVKTISYEPSIETLESKPDIIFVHNIGSGSSFIKLVGTDTVQTIADLLLEAAGARGADVDAFDTPDGPVDVSGFFRQARRNSIFAGTSEIQRSVTAKRVLGLP